MSRVILGDCLEVMPGLADKSVDAIITDPPYGINLDTWDKPVDVKGFTAHAARLTKGFYCFFGQM